MAKTRTIEDIRAQHAALEKEIAAASIPLVQDVIAALGGEAAQAVVDAVTQASAALDEVTKGRIAAWAKMRDDMLTLLSFDLARMQALVEPADADATAR
jgi:hypothetical protein